MLYHNENDSDGIQQVLTAMHKYVSYYGDGVDRVYTSQGLVADLLSVEHGVNALFELANGFTPEEQLEGLHLEMADWHAGNKFLKVNEKFFLFSLANKLILTKVYLVGRSIAKEDHEVSYMHKHPQGSTLLVFHKNNINLTQMKTNHYYFCLTPIFPADSVPFFRVTKPVT